jgi:uncharacterized protein YdeI (YjbR/CyaY-like superfamily)
MCFGWVDSKMYSYDDDYCVLRYQPRRPKSTWAARNRDVAERLVVAGRMQPSGFAQIESATAGGLWAPHELRNSVRDHQGHIRDRQGSLLLARRLARLTGDQ